MYYLIICYRTTLYVQVNNGSVRRVNAASADSSISQAVDLPGKGHIFVFNNEIVVGSTTVDSLQTSQCDPLRAITRIELWIRLNDESIAKMYAISPTSTLNFLRTYNDKSLVIVNDEDLSSTLIVYEYSLQTSESNPLRVVTRMKMWIKFDDEVATYQPSPLQILIDLFPSLENREFLVMLSAGSSP